jgi:hypothetical protein
LGNTGQKQGNSALWRNRLRAFVRDAEFRGQRDGMRARTIDVMSLPFGATAILIPGQALGIRQVGMLFTTS